MARRGRPRRRSITQRRGGLTFLLQAEKLSKSGAMRIAKDLRLMGNIARVERRRDGYIVLMRRH